ncbi:MAG: hypothetical protein KGQ59_02270 [Bdellovibrionales bacterium]|nr:hypothetical protein [Bdellovibrionales bacterium]
MWLSRWLYASLPAQVIGAALFGSIGIALLGPVWGLVFCAVAALIVLFAWLGLGYLAEASLENFWSARSDTLLLRAWIRAFEEVGAPVVSAPLFFVSAELAPIFVFWSGRGGRRAIVVSSSWLSSRTEAEVRAAFRGAVSGGSDDGLRWRAAHAWFVAALIRRIPESVHAALWRTRGGSGSTAFQWMVSLPLVAWLIWVQKAFTLNSPSQLVSHTELTSLRPSDPARRAAAELLSIEKMGSEKTILSFAPQG